VTSSFGKDTLNNQEIYHVKTSMNYLTQTFGFMGHTCVNLT